MADMNQLSVCCRSARLFFKSSQSGHLPPNTTKHLISGQSLFNNSALKEMAPRRRFCYVFSKDPPAADFFREDQIRAADDSLPLQKDSACIFPHEKTKDNFEDVRGIVLQLGLKKDMVLLNVNSEGQLISSKGIGTRKQEMEKRRMEQVNAQQLQLQQISDQLFTEGADSVADALLQPVVREKKKRPPSLPKARPPEVLEKIKQMVADLPCFSPSPQSTKTEIYKDSGVYCNQAKLAMARLRFRASSQKPEAFHRALLHLTLPDNILRLDGISATGTRGCVGVDPRINEAITMCVASAVKEAGGNFKDINYDPLELLTNLIDNTRRTKGVWKILPEVDTPGTSVPPPSDPFSVPQSSSATATVVTPASESLPSTSKSNTSSLSSSSAILPSAKSHLSGSDQPSTSSDTYIPPTSPLSPAISPAQSQLSGSPSTFQFSAEHRPSFSSPVSCTPAFNIDSSPDHSYALTDISNNALPVSIITTEVEIPFFKM